MSCQQCQGVSQDDVRCERKASCKKGCYIFCWQHAKMYDDGRAQDKPWQKKKGCTAHRMTLKQIPNQQKPEPSIATGWASTCKLNRWSQSGATA